MPRWLPGGQAGEATLADGVVYPTIGNRSIMFNQTTSSVMWPGSPESAREVLYSLPASNGNVFVLGGPLPYENADALVCGTTPCDATTHYCRNRAGPGAAGFYANLTNQQCGRGCQVPFDWSQRDPSNLVCAIRTNHAGHPHYHTLMDACQAQCLGYPLAYLGSCQISTCEAIGSTDAPSGAPSGAGPSLSMAPTALPTPAPTAPPSAGLTTSPTSPTTTDPTMSPTVFLTSPPSGGLILTVSPTDALGTQSPATPPTFPQPTPDQNRDSVAPTVAPTVAPASTQPTSLSVGTYSGVFSYLGMFTCTANCDSFAGTATMTLAADGSTTVRVDVTGLAGTSTYPAHLHTSPCTADNPGGGHYQSPVCRLPCTANTVNEVWPTVTTDSAGAGSTTARVDWQPLEDDIHFLSVVIHDTAVNGAGKMVCADLALSTGVASTGVASTSTRGALSTGVASTSAPVSSMPTTDLRSTSAPSATVTPGTGTSKSDKDDGSDSGSDLTLIIGGAAAVVVVVVFVAVVLYYKVGGGGGGGGNLANYETREASFSNPLYGSNPLDGEVMNDPDAAYTGGNGVSGGYMDVNPTGNGGGYMDVYPTDSYGDDSDI